MNLYLLPNYFRNYGTQRGRAGLPRKTTRGEVLFGPEPPPKAVGVVAVNEERMTARQALEWFPKLRGFLQQKGSLKEKSLQAKVIAWKRKGKIPNHIFDPESEIVPRGRLLGNNVVGHYTIHFEGNNSPTDFLNSTRNVVIRFLRERPQNKVQLSLICVMVRVDSATGEVTAEEQSSFNSKQQSVFGSTDLEEVYERIVSKMLEAFATYLRSGSGWMLKSVVRLDITLNRLRPLRGSSHIELPKVIAKRKALINMENDGDECFKWAVTRALNPVEKNPQRVTKELRGQSEELDWDRIEFLMPCLERVFKTFERNNNVSLLVFGYEDTVNNTYIIPLYVPTERRQKVVRLFFLKNEDGTESHYCVVKNMSALVSSQASKKKEKKYVCDFCLNMFGSQELLDDRTDVPKWFDTSNYPKRHPIGGANKKVFGIMKDEAGGETISEFVGLRSKLYAYKLNDGKADKKCKGVKKAVVKNSITFENYKGCLFNGVTHRARFNTLRSRRYEITTECITKVALSANDDKRCLIPNDPEHRTLAIGHWRTKHPALHEVEINTDELSKEGSLMRLAYDAINGLQG